MIEGTWKYCVEPGELFDLAADPGETHNCATDEEERCARLRQAYDAWFAMVCGEWGPASMSAPAIIVGSEAEPRTLLTQNDRQLVNAADGWRRDDLHGFWHIANAAEGPFDIRVLFREGVPSGTVHLRAGGKQWQARLEAGTELVLRDCFLHPGEQQIEAWLALDEPLATACYGRYLSALYIELDQRRPVAI